MTNEAALKLARSVAAQTLCRGEQWKPGVKNGVHHEIIDGKHDGEAIVQIALAAILEVTERAAGLAESDALILSESRSPTSFGKTRKDHGELIAARLREMEHLS